MNEFQAYRNEMVNWVAMAGPMRRGVALSKQAVLSP